MLTADGVSFFEGVCLGRAGSERMFTKTDGEPWLKSSQIRRMRDACKRAKITPAIGYHGLRHTWACLAITAGIPLLVAARNLGHTDTRMAERHYGHLKEDYVTKTIRETAPRFGKVASNVKAIS